MSTVMPDRVPDVRSRASTIASVLSQSALAELLGVNRSSVSRWVRGQDSPASEHATALIDLDYVLAIYGQLRDVETFRTWLTSPNAFLNGATPHHVLELEGPTRVIGAVRAEAAGSFA